MAHQTYRMGDTTLMSKIMPLFTIYRNLRVVESQLDALLGAHQKDPESSEWTNLDYQELKHVQSCITNAELNFFPTLSDINDRMSEEDETWLDFMERPEMHINYGKLIWEREK